MARPGPADYTIGMAVNVLVVGSDPLARAGLASLLAGEPRVAVAFDAAPDDLDEALRGRDIHALLIDAGATAEGLRDLEGAPPAVVLLQSETHAAEALGAGARGVLLRDADGPQIAAALQAAAQGLTVLDSSLSSTLLRSRAAAGPAADALTPRESEVLGLLALGMANKAIAGRLGISDHTAKFHVNAILAKLGAGSRSEAIVRAARLGLISL